MQRCVPLVDVLLLSQSSRYESDGRQFFYLEEIVCQKEKVCLRKRVVGGGGGGGAVV
jgi:hypothetical protein